jgi:hypothetical protein
LRCAAIAPTQQPPFDSFSAEKQDQDKRHDEKNEPHGQPRVVGALSELQQIPQTARGGDELSQQSIKAPEFLRASCESVVNIAHNRQETIAPEPLPANEASNKVAANTER